MTIRTLCLLFLALSSVYAADDGGKIVCTPETFQTKAGPDVETVHAEFTIKNTFSSVAHVANITPSCTCLTVAPFKRDIPAGGSVVVLVDVDIKDHDGPQSKEVVLDLEGVPCRQLTLPILILRSK